jgi:hypothetical protein
LQYSFEDQANNLFKAQTIIAVAYSKSMAKQSGANSSHCLSNFVTQKNRYSSTCYLPDTLSQWSLFVAF